MMTQSAWIYGVADIAEGAAFETGIETLYADDDAILAAVKGSNTDRAQLLRIDTSVSDRPIRFDLSSGSKRDSIGTRRASLSPVREGLRIRFFWPD